MSFIYKFIAGVVALALCGAAAFVFWAQQPILSGSAPLPFSIRAGSGVSSAAQQISDAGVPLNGTLFELLVRASRQGARLKAGNYELKPGTTPWRLVEQLARGEFAQESLTIIEGWNFRQMRKAMASHPGIRQDTAGMSDQQILDKLGIGYKGAEGLFFPDTYLFAKGASDLQILKQAHAALMKKLNEQWDKRDASLPYKSPYDALIMASIVEKETGMRSERGMIAGVFVNRLRKGMLLQTDPTVIYGMGESYQGNIRKRDLTTDTPYNTYTRAGLPPTPIALMGAESLAAAFHPAATDALYFVSRGNGSSHFSNNLDEHNRAVNQYQRNLN
jgi:UPF0755 protein